MIPFLRNRHAYGEPLEFRRLRKRAEADERHAVDSYDLPDDREREYAPVPWWAIDPSFKTCSGRPESLVMVGSRSTPVAPSACLDQAGATEDSAASVTPPAGGAPASRKAA